MVGAYTTFVMCQVFHLNFFISLAIAVSVVTLLAFIGYRFIFHYIRGDILLCTAASDWALHDPGAQSHLPDPGERVAIPFPGHDPSG